MILQWLTEHWNVVAGIAVVLATLFSSQIGTGLKYAYNNFPKLSLGGTTAPVEGDVDALDLAAFKRLTARYERLGCKEGQEAMKTAGQHFLHTEGH